MAILTVLALRAVVSVVVSLAIFVLVACIIAQVLVPSRWCSRSLCLYTFYLFLQWSRSPSPSFRRCSAAAFITVHTISVVFAMFFLSELDVITVIFARSVLSSWSVSACIRTSPSDPQPRRTFLASNTQSQGLCSYQTGLMPLATASSSSPYAHYDGSSLSIMQHPSPESTWRHVSGATAQAPEASC